MRSEIEILAQREIVQGYYNKIFYEKPDIETILQWLESDLEHLRGDDAISIVDKIVNTRIYWYQPLFDLMSKEHGKILVKSEMDDIIITVQKMLNQ